MISDYVKNQKAWFPVQDIIRPQTLELHNYRGGYAGKQVTGSLSKGDM